MTGWDAEGREYVFVPHAYDERRVDLGEVRMNYVRFGAATKWSIGDWNGMRAAAPSELSPAIAAIAAAHETPPQNLREYDPEWGRAFWTGTVAESCDHARMLAAVKVPVLLTHHFRRVDADTGHLLGALADLGAANVRALVEGAAQPFDYRSFPRMGHSMHGQDPQLFVDTLVDWWTSLDAVR